MQPLTIAAVSILVYYGSAENVQKNLDQVEKWTRLAAEEGADLVLFNETGITAYWQNPEIRKLAEPLDGPIVQRLTGLAKELDVIICAGMAEKAGDKVHNTQVLVGPDGLIGYHRKSSFASGEEKYFDVGNDLNTFDIAGWKAGVAICFESVHPETCAKLGEKGVDIILAPYCNGVTRQEIEEGKRPYFRERARDNGVWYVVSDQCGSSNGSTDVPERAGAACFVNPEGEIVAVTSLEEKGEHMIVHTLPAKPASSKAGD
jgi:nitrilase/N-carbamoylputrescine amidase